VILGLEPRLSAQAKLNQLVVGPTVIQEKLAGQECLGLDRRLKAEDDGGEGGERPRGGRLRPRRRRMVQDAIAEDLARRSPLIRLPAPCPALRFGSGHSSFETIHWIVSSALPTIPHPRNDGEKEVCRAVSGSLRRRVVHVTSPFYGERWSAASCALGAGLRQRMRVRGRDRKCGRRAAAGDVGAGAAAANIRDCS
jgi:hypothetical protein